MPINPSASSNIERDHTTNDVIDLQVFSKLSESWTRKVMRGNVECKLRLDLRRRGSKRPGKMTTSREIEGDGTTRMGRHCDDRKKEFES